MPDEYRADSRSEMLVIVVVTYLEGPSLERLMQGYLGEKINTKMRSDVLLGPC